MATRARIDPNVFLARAAVSFRVVISPERELGTGSVVECQLPNSLTADKVSPSKVKPWQLEDPTACHHVRVRGGEGSGAAWGVAVRPREFVSVLGFETNMHPSFRGHINVYFRDDVEEPILCMAAGGDSLVSVPELEEYTQGKRAMTQVHHTGWGFDMRPQYHESTRLIEVYSMHGSSELYDSSSSIFMDKNRACAGDAHAGRTTSGTPGPWGSASRSTGRRTITSARSACATTP